MPTGAGSARSARGTYDRQPAWSPEGRRLAFHCGGWICVSDADGDRRRKVVRSYDQSDAPPAWSPDGTTIAFASEGGIAAIQIDGHRQRLIRGTRAGDSEPSWSPDGRTIALTHDAPNTSDHFSALLLVDLETGNRRRLGYYEWNFERPTWSPDGTTIVYARDENALCWQYCPPYSLYAIPASRGENGDGEVRLTHAESDGAPAYSPDGRRIVFSRNGAILVADADGKNVRRITSGGGPAWQPVCTIYGTEGADRLRGSAGSDVICGLGGADVIDAGGGDDVVIGGSGDDRIAGGPGEDRLFGAFGRDTITSRDGTRDVVDGGPGGDLARTDRADVRVSVP